MQLSWAGLWSFRSGLSNPAPLDRQLGFDVSGKTQVKQSLVRQVESMTERELQEFLVGAPVGLVEAFIHRVPQKSLENVLRYYAPECRERLIEAYRNPLVLKRA